MVPALNTISALRPKFRSRQLREAAETGYITDEHRRSRTHITTHPIDNVAPSIAADRDDGIFVEARPHGNGSRVHVTIADVAAHIPMTSTLASAAWERAFTIYRPPKTDPMFPKPLEDRMSLEHQQERLGLTFSIDLDAGFDATHIEFAPTITRSDNSDYAMAAERMKTDPQFRLMNETAQGVRDQLRSRGMPELLWRRHQRSPNLSEEQLAASKLVETFMMLTNEQSARFFSESGLPFLYRNFDYQTLDRDGIARASYSTSPLGHQQLAASGWNGRYCHITSPIRRGPDFLNAQMAHYVHSTLEETKRQLLDTHPHADAAQLHYSCWKHAPQLFTLLTAPLHGGATRKQPLITEWLAARLSDAGCHTITPLTLQPLASQLLQMHPPFTRKQLDHYAESINQRNHTEHLDTLDMRRGEREKLRHDIRLQRLETLRTDSTFTDNNHFSGLLRDAALTGLLPDTLRQEALQRIESGRIHAAYDGLSIMVIARYPDDPAWIELKRAMARAIKHDPATVSGILSMAEEGGHFAGTLTIGETSLPLSDNQSLPDKQKNIAGAIIVLQENDNGTIASPYYSIGHDARSARSHAQYSFLEHYAFGQLRPLEQSSIPNLLYAELTDAERPRSDLIESIVGRLGATLQVTRKESAAGDITLTARVKGGSIRAPIVAQASLSEVGSEARLETAVFRRLLRDPAFKSATQFGATPELEYMLQPRDYLEKRATREGYTLDIAIDEKRIKGGRQNFSAQVTLHASGQPLHTVSRSGPNKDRAIHSACTAMLERQGWSLPVGISNARAWVTDHDEQLPPAKTTGSTPTRTL